MPYTPPEVIYSPSTPPALPEDITPETLFSRFPELEIHPLNVVQPCLDLAIRKCDPVFWGELLADGIMYLAASLITDRVREVAATIGQPMGRARKAEESENFYRMEYENMLRTLPICGFVTC